MKRAAAAILAACLVLSACGGAPAGPEQAPETLAASAAPYTAAQIAWALWEALDAPPAESRGLSSEDPGFGDYLSAYYRLDPETVEDGYVRYAGGMEALEVAVLRLREDADAEEAAEALAAYRDARAGDFTGYLPEQAALAEGGVTASQGSWAALLLCPGAESARELFLACLDGSAPPPEDPAWPESGGPGEDAAAPEQAGPAQEAGSPDEEAGSPAGETAEPPAPEQPAPEQAPPPEQPPEPPPAEEPRTPSPEKPGTGETPPPSSGPYDGQAVRDAWASGDTAGLSEKSLAVLNAAKEVMEQQITEDMSAYDKELAIHDWMLSWGSYDHGTLDHAGGDQGVPDNENPYGFLVLQKGICSGYSSTFQLFMDLLGIECVTVNGTAHGGTDAHAWNLVRLDGDWYAVDVTWDDPSGTIGISPALAHRYFNVTSQFLRSSDHQWTASVPEAEGSALAWTP